VGVNSKRVGYYKVMGGLRTARAPKALDVVGA
jgi:hypothetical protein